MKNFCSLLLLLLLFSCKNVPSQTEAPTDLKNEPSKIDSQYAFFHNKLRISSPVRPYEEDATTTVSKLALTHYSDIKKYS